jgi:SAM-dependent methyltransferase
MNLRPANLLYKYLQIMQFDIHKAMMNNKLSRLSSGIKGRWLDIGAGDQPYVKYFSGCNEYMTTNTKRHYNHLEFEAIDKLTTYWIEDGKNLPLPDNSLDGVACFQVLSVIDKPGEFFREIKRVLKPGGKLLLTTDFIYPVWSAEDRYRHTAFNLQQLCSENSFKVTSVESFGGFASTVYALFMRYMRSFPELWKQKKVYAKMLLAIPYLLFVLLLPIISLKWMVIFGIEKNTVHNTDFTFNLLLGAEKERSS